MTREEIDQLHDTKEASDFSKIAREVASLISRDISRLSLEAIKLPNMDIADEFLNKNSKLIDLPIRLPLETAAALEEMLSSSSGRESTSGILSYIFTCGVAHLRMSPVEETLSSLGIDMKDVTVVSARDISGAINTAKKRKM